VTDDDRQRISAARTIDEVVQCWPATVRVFVRRRMHCVGCDVARFETVADACRIYGQPLEAVLAELRAADEE
jgi:hybrid cluster-associated redox disulfide protein